VSWCHGHGSTLGGFILCPVPRLSSYYECTEYPEVWTICDQVVLVHTMHMYLSKIATYLFCRQRRNRLLRLSFPSPPSSFCLLLFFGTMRLCVPNCPMRSTLPTSLHVFSRPEARRVLRKLPLLRLLKFHLFPALKNHLWFCSCIPLPLLFFACPSETSG
jgi:hypothetical protein